MSVDIKYLKSKGVSAGDYKKIFTAPPEKWPKPLRNRVRLHADRIRDGRNTNLAEWRGYKAIEDAYDVPFNQTTPTICRAILAQRLNIPDTMKALKEWGLSEEDLLLKVPMENGQMGYKLNIPTFYNVYIPFVKAYTDIRLAKLYNDRNQSPFLPYLPLKRTNRNQVLAEIMTDIANTMATWLGYPAVLRQAIQQMLKYGICLTFPREEWYCEKQMFEGTLETVKEGIRHVHPHPTQMGYDLTYPLTSINSDSGTNWLFHWNLTDYGEILDDSRYWNRNHIFSGTNWSAAPNAGNYFKEYFPCALKFPNTSFHPMSRDDKAAYYTTGNRDQAVFLTHMFDKIIPSKLGIGSYQYPVWHRFIYAGDDTPLYVHPCAYTPSWFLGYDFDENSARTPSLSLELIPWQDMLGNSLSQMQITMRQNLSNVTFYDTNIVDKGDIQKLENWGEDRYRKHLFIGFDSMKWARGGISAKEAFMPAVLAKTAITEILQTIPVTLNIMERVLQISAQEAGSAASHQQSKEEIVQTQNAGSNRLNLTDSHVGEGVDAWKRQIRDGAIAYLDPMVNVEVSANIEDVEEHLKELGFKIEGRGEEKLQAKGHKKVIRLESFAASGRGAERATDLQAGQVVLQTIGIVANNADLHQELGAKNIAKILEQAAIMMGAPKDFKLPLQRNGKGQSVITPELQHVLQQLQQTIMQAVAENVAKPAAEQMAQVQGTVQQHEAIIKQLEQIYKIAAAANDKQKLAEAEMQQKLQHREQEFQLDQKRKDAELQAKIAREAQATHAKLSMDAQESQALIQKTEQETAVKVGAQRATAKAKVDATRAATAIKAHQTAADIQLTKAESDAAAQGAPAARKVSESLNYKDAPEQIKRQIEEQAGLTPATEPKYLEKKQPAAKPAKPAAKPAAKTGSK